MARYFEPTPEQEEGWALWLTQQQPAVRAIAERFPPWELFRHKPTGDRVYVRAIAGDGTVTMIVSGDFNKVLIEASVFGVDPDTLEPCELPAAGEPLGAILTQEEVVENLDALRVAVRPDLWVMGEDGKARRKH